MDMVMEFLQSGVLPTVLLLVRAIVPCMALYVVWRCYTSFKKGQRRRDPVVMLCEESTGVRFPVLYWENSIGRSRSCDICLPDATVSRDHAVLMRREEGWVVCDTGSHSGVQVNGREIEGQHLVNIGDTIAMGDVRLTLRNAETPPARRRRIFTGFSREAASPMKLMVVASLVHLLMALQACIGEEGFRLAQGIPTLIAMVMGWGLYIWSIGIQHRVSFEIETICYLLSGMGVALLAAYNLEGIKTQLAAMGIGILLFCFLIWFMNDMDRVARFRVYIAAGAILLFLINLVFGREQYGSKNWIFIGPVSFQPSEFIKIAFVFVGTSTLDRLQTKKNITEFLVFTGICMGFLFIMRDFGTAVIFFSCFLIIAFMRSGSVRTIALILAGAAIGVLLILRFMPYVADRFAGWGHVWEHINDSLGYQQTRVLTYMASGGLFGIGLGQGNLAGIFAADSDLVFGLVCEEQGLLLALVVLLAIAMLTLYARSDVTRSRSTFFSIGACAVAGMLLFQTCLNVFGATDVLPLTGVTLPFISAGGSSMMCVWGLMAFIKASDERTYGARRSSKGGRRSQEAMPEGRHGPAGRGSGYRAESYSNTGTVPRVRPDFAATGEVYSDTGAVPPARPKPPVRPDFAATGEVYSDTGAVPPARPKPPARPDFAATGEVYSDTGTVPPVRLKPPARPDFAATGEVYSDTGAVSPPPGKGDMEDINSWG